MPWARALPLDSQFLCPYVISGFQSLIRKKSLATALPGKSLQFPGGLHLEICGFKLPLLYPWICHSLEEFQTPKHLDAVHMATFARGQLGSIRASHAGRNGIIIPLVPGINRTQSQLCHCFLLDWSLAFLGGSRCFVVCSNIQDSPRSGVECLGNAQD